MEKNDIQHIRKNITTTIYYAIFFPLIILIVALFLVLYITKKVTILEKHLLDTKEILESTILQEKDTRLLINNIINSLEVAIFWKDINGKYMGANNFFLNAAGLKSSDNLIDKNDFDMPWGKNEAQNYINDDKKVLKTGKPRLNFEETQTTVDGDTIYLLTSKVPLTNTKGEKIGILGSYLDISEQKKSALELAHKDKLLAQQSKMAAMGEMLENIAHQWRQPLSVISTASSGLKIQKQFSTLDDDSLYKTLDIITHTAEHLSQTINDFRDYFNPNKEVTKFDLKNIIEKTLYFVQSKFKNRNITIIKQFENIELIGLENELVQVIINILNNSRDAFENCEMIEDKLVLISTFKNEKQNYVYITIQDSAGGIPKDIINRIFEPYFTTKHKSQGTGIGLYMSQEMIEKHMKGELNVENKTFYYENKSYLGALFTIKIPLVTKDL
jgi:PAS domain S-box-containing protein